MIYGKLSANAGAKCFLFKSERLHILAGWHIVQATKLLVSTSARVQFEASAIGNGDNCQLVKFFSIVSTTCRHLDEKLYNIYL